MTKIRVPKLTPVMQKYVEKGEIGEISSSNSLCSKLSNAPFSLLCSGDRPKNVTGPVFPSSASETKLSSTEGLIDKSRIK